MTRDPFNPPPSAPGPTPFPQDAKRSATPWISFLAVLAIALALAAVYVASRAAPSPPKPTAAAPARPASPAPAAGAAPAPSAESPSTANLLEAAGERLGLDHDEAVRRFEHALRAHAESWPSLDASQNRAALDAVVRTIIRAGHDEQIALALDRVLANAARLMQKSRLADNEILPAVWAWGAVAHLASFADLPAPAREGVLARHATIADALSIANNADPFSSAIAAALRRVPPMLTATPEGASGDAGSQAAWRAWLQGVLSAIPDQPARDECLILGAEAALAAASALPPDQITRSIITDILARADWSEQSPARAAVVRWLDAPDRYSSRELSSVLRWLVGRPAASLPDDAALRPDATPDQRQAVRERLAIVWRLQAPALLLSLTQALRFQADALLASAPPASSIDALADAAILARCVAAAERLRLLDVDAAKVILESLRAPVEQARSATLPAHSFAPAPSSDGRWALRFLAARRNAAERRALIADLSLVAESLGPVDAEVLVEFALVGSPTDARIIAQRAVERRVHESAILNALLESLHSAPRNDASARLYQSAVHPVILPPPRDAKWHFEARRALLARILSLSSADADLAVIDRLALVLARALADRIPPDSPFVARLAPEPDHDSAFAALWSHLRADVAAMPLLAGRLDNAESRLRARRSIAVGPAQHAVAETRALAEAVAAATIIERPSLAAESEQILADAEALVANAPSAFHQLRAAHAAILRLALLRLESPPQP